MLMQIVAFALLAAHDLFGCPKLPLLTTCIAHYFGRLVFYSRV